MEDTGYVTIKHQYNKPIVFDVFFVLLSFFSILFTSTVSSPPSKRKNFRGVKLFKFSVQTTKKKSELIFLIEYFIFKLAGLKDVEMRRKQQTYTHVVEST